MSAPGWVRVTPAGCYAAVARERRAEAAEPAPADEAREALLALLSREDSARWSEAAHAALAATGLVERAAEPERAPQAPLERFLPGVLPGLSDRGRTVLSESRQGLFLDCAGLSRDDAERLAATGAALFALLGRDPLLPSERLEVGSVALGIVDASGHAEVGFWPLFVGRYVFMLTVFGVPRFNAAGFRQLVWTLQQRYGGEAPVPGGGSDVGAAFAGAAAGAEGTVSPDDEPAA